MGSYYFKIDLTVVGSIEGPSKDFLSGKVSLLSFFMLIVETHTEFWPGED